jgi:hypothetical protein
LLKFSTLPIVTFDFPFYNYSPQDTIRGGKIAYTENIDLSSEYNINGDITGFEWFDIVSNEEIPIILTGTNGIFTLDKSFVDKTLRCKMRNAQFPGSNYSPFVLVYEVTITDTDNDEDEINFTISPNPVKTQLAIRYSKEVSNILLYDMAGKLLKTYKITETNPVLDISDLATGIYFITIDGKSVKFIKE